MRVYRAEGEAPVGLRLDQQAERLVVGVAGRRRGRDALVEGGSTQLGAEHLHGLHGQSHTLRQLAGRQRGGLQVTAVQDQADTVILRNGLEAAEVEGPHLGGLLARPGLVEERLDGGEGLVRQALRPPGAGEGGLGGVHADSNAEDHLDCKCAPW